MSRSLAGRVCVWLARYLGLLQVAVHGLGDVGSVDGIVVGVLGVVVLLHQAWREQRKSVPSNFPHYH